MQVCLTKLLSSILPIFIGTKTLHYPTILSYFYDNECVWVWNKNARVLCCTMSMGVVLSRKWCFMGTHNYSPHAAVIHCLTREINWLIIRWENYLSTHRAPWFFNTFALLCTAAPHSLKPPLFYVPPLYMVGSFLWLRNCNNRGTLQKNGNVCAISTHQHCKHF